MWLLELHKSKQKLERKSKNDPADDLPPTLPHELVKIPGSIFGDIVSLHAAQLQRFWSEESIASLAREHNALISAYQNEVILKATLDAFDHTTSFEDGWKVIEGRFNILRDFCGGITTIFANTASVESDFSILGWEKDEYRISLTDLLLEGIMQCKQFGLLSKIVQ